MQLRCLTALARQLLWLWQLQVRRDEEEDKKQTCIDLRFDHPLSALHQSFALCCTQPTCHQSLQLIWRRRMGLLWGSTAPSASICSGEQLFLLHKGNLIPLFLSLSLSASLSPSLQCLTNNLLND